MSNQADHTIVRLRVPPELKKLIEESAELNNRSQSAEMVYRLENSFHGERAIADDQIFELRAHTEPSVIKLIKRKHYTSPMERRRLAILAAEAALQALESELIDKNDEN